MVAVAAVLVEEANQQAVGKCCVYLKGCPRFNSNTAAEITSA